MDALPLQFQNRDHRTSEACSALRGLVVLFVIGLVGSSARVGLGEEVQREPVIGVESSDPLTWSYDGKTLDEWRELMKSVDFQSSAAVDAVPGLIAIVEDRQLPWYTRRQAALTLGRIGEPAERAVPILEDIVATQPTGEEASSSTAWAAKSLALYGKEAAPATPTLVRVLRDESRPHLDRLSCIEALGRIGGAHENAIPALIQAAQAEAADSPEANALREAAVDGLALVGNAAAPAVPTLIRLTRDEAGRIRKNAAMALGNIGPASSIAAQALAELVLFDDLREVRDAAADALTTIGDDGESVLRKFLADQDVRVRRLAAQSLGQLQRKSDATVLALQAALDDPDPTVQIAAAESFWSLTRSAEPILTTILNTLTSEDRQLRIRAYRLLLTLGVAARPAIPELRRLARNDRAYVRQVAKKALEELPLAKENKAKTTE